MGVWLGQGQFPLLHECSTLSDDALLNDPLRLCSLFFLLDFDVLVFDPPLLSGKLYILTFASFMKPEN